MTNDTPTVCFMASSMISCALIHIVTWHIMEAFFHGISIFFKSSKIWMFDMFVDLFAKCWTFVQC